MAKLTSRLMIEETRLGINDISMGALMAKKQFKGNSIESTAQRIHKKDEVDNSKIKLKCWTCGGPHLRRDCPQRKKNGNNQDKQKENTHGLAMVSFSNMSDTTKWIIDSGYTEHVCWQIEYFINYENLKETVIFVLGDGCKSQQKIQDKLGYVYMYTTVKKFPDKGIS